MRSSFRMAGLVLLLTVLQLPVQPKTAAQATSQQLTAYAGWLPQEAIAGSLTSGPQGRRGAAQEILFIPLRNFPPNRVSAGTFVF